MDHKKIIIILVVICVILAVALVYMVSNDSTTVVNNVTNDTVNKTLNLTNDTVNATLVSYEEEEDSSSYEESSSSDSEPEYGSESYVDRWDESQKNEDSWAYLHDQPVKTDDDGHRYKRMYDEESGESYWYQMN